jgi:hypothetical protein
MARHLDEAFAGCEEWTPAPPSPRRADALDLAPWQSDPRRSTNRAAARPPDSRAA